MNNEEKAVIERLKTGKMLKELRLKRELTIAELGKIWSITGNYVSEIERGMKVPSDHLIMKIAKFFELDEDSLFEGFGKVPLLARQEFEHNKSLQRALSQVAKSKNLTEERKEKIYDQVFRALSELLQSEEKNG